jgi:NhaP-type Na+/H+ or K+/H+ antiporter
MFGSIILDAGSGFLSPYALIIGASIILILSYLYGILADKTNIPSVLLLILTGILIKLGMDSMEMEADLRPVLEILGIVGLIMIVLEAALDLELNKEKLPLIGKSLLVAVLCLIGSAGIIGLILTQLNGMEWGKALLYATPLSIMSSAIIIPSVNSLMEKSKEFMIYESTFSDIIGIMFFYFLISFLEEGASAASMQFGFSFILTAIVSVVASYVLVYFFKDLKGHTRLFLLIAVLLLLYSLGKLIHLSPLLIILVFGLALSNHQTVFKIFKNDFDEDDPIEKIEKEFHLITLETAFVVRTFFFVIFGMTINLSSLANLNVLLTSILILAGIYAFRWIALKLFASDHQKPELFIAPRGLITILLFFAIPAAYIDKQFDSGILLYVIIISSLVMSWALIMEKKKTGQKEISKAE